MPPKDRKRWLYQEEIRLEKYQHQHRGLNFKKLFLPPITDRKVNLVGRDNHIYRGSVPRVPLDQLPPEVDESSIDEEALYKEIREMNFPPVPEQEPLGPSRRIGGKYTLAKRMTLAPIHINCTEGLEETLVLGKDGGVYRSKGKYPSRIELDKKIRGTKRQIEKVIRTSSSRGYVEPSLVLLHTSDKPPLYGKHKKSLIQLPTAEIGSILAMVKRESIQEKQEEIIHTINQNETTELEQEDFQTKADKTSEKSEETETGDETNIEETETGDETNLEETETGDETNIEETETGDETNIEETGDETNIEETETRDETNIKETETGDETNVGEQRETGTEKLSDIEISVSTGKTDEESDTESTEIASGETKKPLYTEEIKETIEESDIESIETDSEESLEAEKDLDTGEIKETVEESDSE